MGGAKPQSASSKKAEINKMANSSNNIKSKLLEAQFLRQDRRINQPDLIKEQRAIAAQND